MKLSDSSRSLGVYAVLCAVFCNVLFGSAIPMIKLGYAYFGISDGMFSKILYAGVRFFISGVVLMIANCVIEHRLPVIAKGNKVNVVLLALTYTFLQYMFLYVGYSNTSGTLASVINSSSAFIAIIIAHFVYKDDRINLRKLVGSVVGFFGVLLACAFGRGKLLFSFFGEGFIVIGALFFVIGSVFSKKATEFNNSFTVTAYNLLIGGGTLAIVGLVGGGRFEVTWQGVLVLLYLVFVSSAGFTLWSALIRKYQISKLGVYNFIIPVSGAIISGVVLGDKVWSLGFVFALALVACGIITVNLNAK